MSQQAGFALQAYGEVPKVFLATLKTAAECVRADEAADHMRRQRKIHTLMAEKGLTHPSLVKTLFVTAKNEPADVLVYTTERKFKIHCIVQELCEGGDLSGYLMASRSAGKPFSEPIARYFFQQLMDGIHELHSRALYHMDIQMENVMVAKDQATGAYSVRLGDFGSMRSFTYATRRQETKELNLVKSTDAGMVPPELLKLHVSKKGQKRLSFNDSEKLVDPAKADIWAAGYLLLMLVAVQACQHHRLLYLAPLIDGKSKRSKYTLLTAELKANPIAKGADGKWKRDYLDFLQDKSVVVEEHNAKHEVVRSFPIGDAALTASPELLDLLRSMLHSEPQQRPCASEVLGHAWLQASHWHPSEQVVINDMNSRRKPGTRDDTQVYELPSTCTFGSASEVFALLERAVHGWKVELAPQELLLSIDLAGHIVVCRVLPHVEGQPWKVHCKWEKGKMAEVWMGVFFDLKHRLDELFKAGV
jgi:serine/threonine protein kinase